MNRLVKEALYRPGDAEPPPPDPWEHAAERIRKFDPDGKKSATLLRKILGRKRPKK